jgi:hypothetical protein
VYVMNVRYHKSKDGGRTFSAHSAPHGDHHDLWISPEDSKSMIIGDDGGAQVSFDGGENWSTYHNQPTAQFYRVTTDNHFPYRIYGAQQDNSTVRISHTEPMAIRLAKAIGKPLPVVKVHISRLIHSTTILFMAEAMVDF